MRLWVLRGLAAVVLLMLLALTLLWNKRTPALRVAPAGFSTGPQSDNQQARVRDDPDPDTPRPKHGNQDQFQAAAAAAAEGLEGVAEIHLKFPSEVNQLKRSRATVESIKQQLLEGMIAPNAHYFWCGTKERWFEFKHYLSIVSITKSLLIDTFYLYYESSEPVPDKMYYNLWYDDLKHDLPFFVPRLMEDWQRAYCGRTSGLDKLNIILRTVNSEGGLFVTENTWMMNISATRRLVDLELGFDLDQMEGSVMMRAGFYNNNSVDRVLGSTSPKIRRCQCSQIHHVYMDPEPATCVIVKGGKYDRIWPMDIWELDDPYGRLARRIFYGSEEIRRAEPSYDTLVPNIGHMVWIGGGRMDFVFYLSVLSLLYVAKVDTVFIHGDKEPAGEYWAKVKTEAITKDRVRFIVRPPPYLIYQGVIEPWYRALMSDIIRVDLMIKYGGIYTDTDAIWSKPLTLEDRGYDAVASFDWVDWSWPYPDSVNFGISYGKKNAPFWQVFRESMRKLINEHHGFTGVMMPYKLLEKYPHLLRIDKHLSAICYYSKCHPLWVDDYHNMTKDHTNTHSLDNWRQDLTAFHWTYPNPVELDNMTILMQSTGIFADLGKFVLGQAGVL